MAIAAVVYTVAGDSVKMADPPNTDAATLTTNIATAKTAEATVAANVATLVADGASPTQAHVTTLNTNWGTLKTAIDALDTTSLTANLAGNVTLIYDKSVVTNRNQLAAALRAFAQAVQGDNSLTAA